MSDSSTPEVQDTALTRLTRDPLSRRRFFVAAGGTTAASALLVACGDDDSGSVSSGDNTSTAADVGASNDAIAQFGKGDIGILNYALTLEYIEDDFYGDVVASGLFKGDDLALIKSFGKDEAAHVAALTQTVRKLGAKPAPKPKTKFPTTRSRCSSWRRPSRISAPRPTSARRRGSRATRCSRRRCRSTPSRAATPRR